MSTQLFSKLRTEVEQRRLDENLDTLQVIPRIYEGKIPEEYQKYFPQNEPQHIINMTRLAHDDLATTVGRMPDIYAPPINSTNAELKKTGLLENIAFSYLANAEPRSGEFMWELAWWMLVGRAVVMVRPDPDKGGPVPVLRDPRRTYPGVKRRHGNRPAELYDCIFKYTMSASEAKRLGFGEATQRDQWGNVSVKNEVEVYEYIDAQYWGIVAETGVSQMSEHGLGYVPVHIGQAFAPDSKAGLSHFADQISLMIAISRLISQKLAFGDRLVYPAYWVKGHEGNIKLGPYTINKLGPQGEMGSLAPTNTFQADRDIEMLERFSRILNRNTEVRQGEISARSTYTSAKTLEQLAEAIDTVIGRYWDIISNLMEDVFETCFKMDEKLWPNKEKSIRGVKKGSRYDDAYVPARDIDRYQVEVSYGFGIGGYQGFLQNMQSHQAGLNPKRKAVENMPGVTDVDQHLREIELDQMDEVLIANFMSMAGQGQIDALIWADVRMEMAKKGLRMIEAIQKYNQRLQEQAAQAQAAGQPEMGMTLPPQEQMAPEPELPGLPPAALAGV